MEMNINPALGVSTITVLEGKALEPQYPQTINIEGTPEAPGQFFTGKRKLYQPDYCHILVNYNDGTIVFKAFDNEVKGSHTVTGKLTENPELKPFKINSEDRWTVSDFVKYIRQTRHFFADKGQHSTLVNNLQQWKIKVERVIQEKNDNSGNSNYQLETKIKDIELLKKFDLLIPIYKGYAPVKFEVEIGIDPRNTDVALYLISDELFELKHLEKHSIISSSLAPFQGFNCSIVTVG